MQAESPEQALASPLRVLVIDDDKNIRVTLRVCLEGLGCETREAANADAALTALAERPYDLAFLDLRLGADERARPVAAAAGRAAGSRR